MKKTKLFLLLSLPMVLASCGSKGEKSSSHTLESYSSAPSSEVISTPESSQSSLDSSSSQSEPVVDERTEEEKNYDIYEKNYNAIKSSIYKMYKTPKASTATLLSTNGYSTININTPNVGEKSEAKSESVEHDWYITSYDPVSKTGYTINEDDYSDEPGVRSLYSQYWTANKEGKTYVYDSSCDECYEADEEYCWADNYNGAVDETVSFFTQNSFYMYASEYSRIQSYLDGLRSTFAGSDENHVGTYTKEVVVTASEKVEGSLTQFDVKFDGKINYTAPKALSTYDEDPFYSKAEVTCSCEYKITYNNDTIISFEEINLEHVMTEAITKDETDYESYSYTYAASLTFEDKYTPFTAPDASSYTELGPVSTKINFYLGTDNKKEVIWSQKGQPVGIKPENFLPADALTSGITVKVYEDEAHTKEILDLEHYEVKGHSENFYLEYVIPEDVVFVQCHTQGSFLEAEGTYVTNYKLAGDSIYVGAPKKNFFVPAHEAVNAWNPFTEVTDSYLVVPYKTIIWYTTDENATIRNDKYITLTGGNYYSLMAWGLTAE